MSEKHVKYLIIGGGISGLCAALALGPDVLILEKESEPGGYCRSIRQDGFLWDHAGHFFHFRTEQGRQFFLSQFKTGELVQKQKRCQILYEGAKIDYPFQSHIHQLEKSEMIDCLYDLFHRPFKAHYSSFLELLEGCYGHAVTEKFLRPYNEKLYACSLNTLDPAAMGRFFPAADPAEIIDSMKGSPDSSYNSSFYYPKDGAGALIEALCRQLAPGAILTGREITSVDANRKTAFDSRGDRYRYEVLINTSPLHRFLTLLGEAGLTDQAKQLSGNKVLVLNLGFQYKAPDHSLHWLYVPGADANYYRIGFYDNVLDGDRTSVYVEIGFPEKACIDTESELKQSLRAMRAQGLIQKDNPLLSHCALVMDPAYVHLRPETNELVGAVKAKLAGMDIYSIGRYGGWRYCSMEDCMLEAFSLADTLKNRFAAGRCEHIAAHLEAQDPTDKS